MKRNTLGLLLTFLILPASCSQATRGCLAHKSKRRMVPHHTEL
jgi:hypothetical protein